MEQPVLTVIVPVYNTAPYLEECLTSIFKQDVPGMEVLLIDADIRIVYFPYTKGVSSTQISKALAAVRDQD